MKKLLALLVICLSVTFVNGAFVTTKSEIAPTAEEIKHQQERAIMEKVAHMSVKDYEALTGKKLNMVDKLTFKLIKNQFKKKLAADDTSGFNIGGFLLGLVLGLLGVLGAYIFSKDPNFRKWTWIGWGVWVVILLITLAV